METKKCSSCERCPQKLDQFFDKFGRPCSVCLKCRIRTNRNRKPRPPTWVCNKCPKTSCFNFPGQTPGIYCAEHREPGMINVIQKNCDHEGCLKQPCYNLPNEHFGKFCASHKTPEMVNVRERPCEHEGCRKKPFFNLLSETKGRFCASHKTDDMVNVLEDKCEHDGCLKRAGFNLEGEKGRFCATHKENGMVNVVSKRCKYENCTTIPVFNFTGSKTGKFCRAHKLEGMIDVENPRCKTPMCDIILGGKNEYCVRCSSYTFPNQPSRFKTREMKLKEYLVTQYPEKTIVHDKRVECHLYRPDFVFDMGSHVIVIELDENQHRSYDTSCDNKRLMSIFHGLCSRPMVMIRFNPDKYDSVSGCFKKDGQLLGQGKEWNLRTEKLKSRVDFWIDAQPDREITVEHLFFDSTNG